MTETASGMARNGTTDAGLLVIAQLAVKGSRRGEASDTGRFDDQDACICLTQSSLSELHHRAASPAALQPSADCEEEEIPDSVGE